MLEFQWQLSIFQTDTAENEKSLEGCFNLLYVATFKNIVVTDFPLPLANKRDYGRKRGCIIVLL